MRRTDKCKAILGFLVVMAICFVSITSAIYSRITAKTVRLEQLTTDSATKISEAISTPINQIYIVSKYIEHNNGDLTNIDELASIVVEGDYVRNLIIAPDGVVSKVYPDTEDNQNVIGLNYFSDSSQGNKEAIIAMENREILLAGPFKTVVGDYAISGRIPVYLKNEIGEDEFWGILSITLRYPEVLGNANMDILDNQGITYELWHENVDTHEHTVILSNGVIDTKSKYIDKPVELLNSQWVFRCSPVPRWYQLVETWIYLLVAILISGMAAIMINKNSALKIAKQKLEQLVYYDSLTMILNRKGLYLEIEKLIDKNQKFQINYLDLDKFKQINDEYGHNIGDLVLVEFASRINKHIDENYIFGRISGDEFVIIYISNDPTSSQADEFWDKIADEFKKTITNVDGDDIFAYFSRGSALFPDDSNEIDGILSFADKRMYAEKRQRAK